MPRTMINTTTALDATRQSLAELVLRAAEPGLRLSERAAKARTLGDQAADLRDIVRAAGVLDSGRVADAVHATRHPDDTATHERIGAREVIDQIRAVQLLLPSDVTGAVPAATQLLPGVDTGLANGVPLIRDLATPWTDLANRPLIPPVPTGDLDGQVLAPGDTVAPASSFQIADAPDSRFSVAAAIGEVAKQVFDWTDNDAAGFLDQLFLDIADRAAERYIGAQLVAAAGIPIAAGGNLADAIDTAEGASAAELQAPADLVIVHPADLPDVRRAVADSWQLDPHPALLASIAAPLGSVIVTGRRAFTLLARPVRIGADTGPQLASKLEAFNPAGWSVDIAVMRDFLLQIRQPAAVQIVQL